MKKPESVFRKRLVQRSIDEKRRSECTHPNMEMPWRDQGDYSERCPDCDFFEAD